MKIIKQTIVEKFGMRLRLVKYEPGLKTTWQEIEIKNLFLDPYWVEQTPLQYGVQPKHDDWMVFGGGVGMLDSTFQMLEDAERFYNDILMLTDKEMLKKYPHIWYGD